MEWPLVRVIRKKSFLKFLFGGSSGKKLVRVLTAFEFIWPPKESMVWLRNRDEKRKVEWWQWVLEDSLSVLFKCPDYPLSLACSADLSYTAHEQLDLVDVASLKLQLRSIGEKRDGVTLAMERTNFNAKFWSCRFEFGHKANPLYSH